MSTATGVGAQRVIEDYADAKELANRRFNAVEGVAADALNTAYSFLDDLKKMLDDIANELPDTELSYDKQSVSLDYTTLDRKRPDAPTDEQLTPAVIPYPNLRQALSQITVPYITPISEAPDDLVSPSLSFEEALYQSNLLPELEAKLLDWLQNGGTGLGEDALDALWEREREKTRVQHERNITETIEYIANQGWEEPPDATKARIAYIQAENSKDLLDRGRSIIINEAELMHKTSLFSVTSTTELEKMLRGNHLTIQGRAFEYAKSTVGVILEVYKTHMDGYVKKNMGTEISARVADITVNAHSTKNRSITDIFKADIFGYSEQVKAEIGLVEIIAKVFGYKISGYNADINGATAIFDAKIKEYLGRIDQENHKTALDESEMRFIFDAYFKNIDFNIEGLKTLVGTSTQVAASALAGISVVTSLGYDQRYSHGTSITATDPAEQAKTVHYHTYKEK